ncbi:MAG: hypothetical protein ACJAWS_002692 [Oleiphilaceae bacterium]|jgi:hypothetical protein
MGTMSSLGRITTMSICVSLLGGCATSSLFQSYPSQAESFQHAISLNSPEQDVIKLAVLEDLNEERESADAMLYMMERGRINQLNASFADSKTDFELVIAGFEEQDLESTIEVGETLAQGASLLTNDNAIPYEGAGYERVFTHHHQAFNYLGQNDLGGASVEFRKVALEQRILLEKHEKEVAEAYEDAEENEIDLNTLSSEFSGLDNVAGKVKSSFQNAYTFYASGAFWETQGDLSAAWVDYKKAFEINSNNTYLKQDIARVAKKLGEKPDQKELNEAKAGQGTVVVFFEDGFVPAKSEIKIPVPTFDGGFISLAFPYYETDIWPVSASLRAIDDQFNDLGTSEVVVDVSALAVKDLKEQIPQLLVRQALRGFAKYQLQKQSGDHGGMTGQLLASLYNVISESADRRSWLTLPHTAQVMRFNLDAGKREVNLSTALTQVKLDLDIKANRTIFVRVVNANNQLMTQVYTL